MAYNNSHLAAYRTAAAHGQVGAADPHGLVLLLMDGALQRIAKARGCMQNKSYAEKAQLIHRAVAIVDQLRNALDLKVDGGLAQRLDSLYDYICQRLLQATVENNVVQLDEVSDLLQGLRDTWQKIPLSERYRPAR